MLTSTSEKIEGYKKMMEDQKVVSDKKVRELEKQIAGKDDHITHLLKVIEEKDARIRELNADNEALMRVQDIYRKKMRRKEK